MSFNCIDGYDSLRREANIPAANNYSMSGWFYITGQSTAAVVCPLLSLSDAYNASPTTIYQGVHVNSTATDLQMRRNFNSNIDFSADPSTNAWIYVAMSCAGTGTDQYKGYWWNAAGTLSGTVSTTTTDATATPTVMAIGARNGATFTGYCAYIRVWDAVLSQSEFEAEQFSPTIVRTSNINTAIGTNDEGDVSGNGRNWTQSSAAFDTSGTNEPPIGGARRLLLLGVG